MKLASYKGTRRGFKGLLNRAIRWWTNSIYSHNELVFEGYNNSEGANLCASSSGSDGGVRFKFINLDPSKWDICTLDIPEYSQKQAMLWFSEHADQGYDYLGLFGFVGKRGIQDKKKWFCSEAIAASLGFKDPEQYTPGMLDCVVKEVYEEKPLDLVKEVYAK